MARVGPGCCENAGPASEKFFGRDCNLSDSAFIQRVIQLCDYLGKWLHLVSKSSHFLLPFINVSTVQARPGGPFPLRRTQAFNFLYIHPVLFGARSSPFSVNRTMTCEPPPNFRVSQSSRSCLRDCRSTLKPASISPLAMGSKSSKALRPVKFLMQKLSSHASGHSLGVPGLRTSTWILLANMLITLSLHNSFVQRIILNWPPTSHYVQTGRSISRAGQHHGGNRKRRSGVRYRRKIENQVFFRDDSFRSRGCACAGRGAPLITAAGFASSRRSAMSLLRSDATLL